MSENKNVPGYFLTPGKKKEKINYIEKNYCKLSAMERHMIVKEDCILIAYQCLNGIWTIGVGETGFNVYKGLEISLEQAIIDMKTNLQIAETEVHQLFTIEELIKMGVERYNIILDLLFNLGLTRLSKFKNFIKFTKEGNYILAALNLLYKEPLKNSQQTPYWKQVKDRALNNAENFIKG